jgi:hypothetical protein
MTSYPWREPQKFPESAGAIVSEDNERRGIRRLLHSDIFMNLLPKRFFDEEHYPNWEKRSPQEEKGYPPPGYNESWPSEAGLLDSDVPGRTDQIPLSVRTDSYVVPADVVSGLGQGNTSAGAVLLDQIFGDHHKSHMASGGSVPQKRDGVDIVVAGGEYIVHPEVVRSIGGGDPALGHQILDKMVRRVRKDVARRIMKLPGPRRD